MQTHLLDMANVLSQFSRKGSLVGAEDKCRYDTSFLLLPPGQKYLICVNFVDK